MQSITQDCSTDLLNPATRAELEFYRINQNSPLPNLDHERDNLVTDLNNPTSGLTPVQVTNFNLLRNELTRTLNSQPACPGDGNGDLVVDAVDLANWRQFQNKGSSWYDFNHDGLTDEKDLAIIQANLGKHCR